MAGIASEYVSALAPALPSALVSEGALARLQEAAAALSFVAEGGFECRLGPDQKVIDFQVCLSARQAALGVLSDSPAGQRARDLPAWAPILRWMQAWASSTFSSEVACVWLEFDLHAPPPEAPGVFFFSPTQGASLQGLLASLEQLTGAPLPASQVAAALRCQRALRGRDVASLGLTLGRAEQALALTLPGLSVEQASELLLEIEWPGDHAHAIAVARRFAPFADRLCLMLPIGTDLWPRVGIELYLDKNPAEGWPRLLGELVQEGLCAADKGAGMLAWPGSSSPLPESGLARLAALIGAPNPRPIERRINHVKLTCSPGQSTEAKGYLAFRHGGGMI